MRDGIEATWVERDFNFDAALLHPGANTIVLTVPAGPVGGGGICYDVVRLEVAPTFVINRDNFAFMIGAVSSAYRGVTHFYPLPR